MLGSAIILFASIKVVGSVCCIFALGVALAWRGVLDSKGVRVLGNLANTLLVPALFFSSIGRGMSFPYMKQNWGLVVAGLVITLIGAFFGRLLLPLAKPEQNMRPWFVLACAFPNMLAIPLVFVDAICRSESETKGEVAECVGDATTKLFSFVLFFPLLVFGAAATYVRYSQAADPVAKEESRGRAMSLKRVPSGTIGTPDSPGTVVGHSQEDLDFEGEDLEGANPAVVLPVTELPLGDTGEIVMHIDESDRVSERQGMDRVDARLLDAINVLTSRLARIEDAVCPPGEIDTPNKHSNQSSRDEEPLAKPAAGSQEAQPQPESVGGCRWQFNAIVLQNPPVMATLAALLVAFIPPLQALLFGEDAPLNLVTNSIAMLGQATTPVMNIIMAASLGLQLKRLERVSDLFGGPVAGFSRRTLFVLVLCKMILVPATIFTILYFVQDSLPEDRWYRLLMFIEAASPTANTVVLLASIMGQTEVAQTLALTSITQFVVFVPASTFFVAAGMSFTSHL